MLKLCCFASTLHLRLVLSASENRLMAMVGPELARWWAGDACSSTAPDGSGVAVGRLTGDCVVWRMAAGDDGRDRTGAEESVSALMSGDVVVCMIECT